jgi:hypothetical protein
MTMNDMSPEKRAEMIRLLREIKADVTELRSMLERAQARRRH